MTHRRIAQLQKVMKKGGLDALFVSSLANIRYLTGFSGSNALLLVRPRSSVFLSDPRYLHQSRDEVQGSRRIISATGLFESVARNNLLSGLEHVGFEARQVSYHQYRVLRRLFPDVVLHSTAGLVEELAVVKDRSELAVIQEAVDISDSVFGSILKLLRPGARECEIAAEISYQQRVLGAEADAFEPIVASGRNGAFPHAKPSTKKIRNGEMVTLDFGSKVKGYSSDITRTVAVGRVSKRARTLYGIVLDAQEEAIGAARAGIRGKDLDAVARRQLHARGLGKYFTHSLGHGLGLHIHERPRIAIGSEEVLRSGSVVTIEPGVYIPDFGGIRIEDDVVLGNAGCRVMNRASKEFIIL